MNPKNHRLRWSNVDDMVLKNYLNSDMSFSEIAENMGRSVNTIKWRKWFLQTHERIEITDAKSRQRRWIWAMKSLKIDTNDSGERADESQAFEWSELPHMPDTTSQKNHSIDGPRKPVRVTKRALFWGLIRWEKYDY